MRYENKNDKFDKALKCALHTDMKPDDALHQKVLYSWKEERPMKMRKYKAAVAAIAAITGVLLISGGVYAAVTNSNLLAEFKIKGNELSKDAETLVDRDPQIIKVTKEKAKELQYIDYTVDEVVCDDYTIYTRVTITPKDADKYTILGDNIVKSNLNDSVSILNIDGVTEGTVEEYAKRDGRKIIRISCSMAFASNQKGGSEWFEYGKNGEVYCYSSIQDTPDQKKYTEKLCIHEYEGFENHEHGSEYVTLSLDNKSSVNSRKEYKTIADKLDYGIKIEKISTITTELGIYVTIEHTSQIEYDNHGDWGPIVPVISDKSGNEIAELEGHGKSSNGLSSVWQMHYGALDMNKVYIGFRRTYDTKHTVIDESMIGPYALEEVK